MLYEFAYNQLFPNKFIINPISFFLSEDICQFLKKNIIFCKNTNKELPFLNYDSFIQNSESFYELFLNNNSFQGNINNVLLSISYFGGIFENCLQLMIPPQSSIELPPTMKEIFNNMGDLLIDKNTQPVFFNYFIEKTNEYSLFCFSFMHDFSKKIVDNLENVLDRYTEDFSSCHYLDHFIYHLAFNKEFKNKGLSIFKPISSEENDTLTIKIDQYVSMLLSHRYFLDSGKCVGLNTFNINYKSDTLEIAVNSSPSTVHFSVNKKSFPELTVEDSLQLFFDTCSIYFHEMIVSDKITNEPNSNYFAEIFNSLYREKSLLKTLENNVLLPKIKTKNKL